MALEPISNSGLAKLPPPIVTIDYKHHLRIYGFTSASGKKKLFWYEVVSLMFNSQPRGPVPIFIFPGDGWSDYTPRLCLMEILVYITSL